MLPQHENGVAKEEDTGDTCMLDAHRAQKESWSNETFPSNLLL